MNIWMFSGEVDVVEMEEALEDDLDGRMTGDERVEMDEYIVVGIV